MKSLLLVFPAAFAMTIAAQERPQGCCMHGGPQTGGKAPIASNPIVDVNGAIAEVHISPGKGMPYLDVKQESGSTRLYLGAMQFLIAESFSPKAGQRVVARGYKLNNDVIGIEVTLPDAKKTLKLRDEKGWPLWRGGPMHQRGGGPSNR